MSRSMRVATVVAIMMAGVIYASVERGRTLRANQALHRLPGTARAVLRIDAAALSRSGAARHLLATLVPEERLSEIETACGLAPLEALSEVVVWVRGPEDQPLESMGLMLRGRTANAEMLAQCHRTLVEARGSSISRIETASGPVLRSRDGRSAVSQVDDRTIVTGSSETVAEFSAVRLGIIAPLVDETRFRRLWSLVSLGSAVAGVFDAPPHWRTALERLTEIDAGGSALEGVEALALRAEADSPHAVTVYIEVGDPKRAQEDAVFLRSWADSPPDTLEVQWVEILKSARIRAQGTLIVVNLDISSLSRRP